jgi:hypothetical protein
VLAVISIPPETHTNDKVYWHLKDPVLVYPHDYAESGKVWLHLFCYSRLLDLDRHPVPSISVFAFQSSAMYLSDAGTGNGGFLELGEKAIRPAKRTTELFLEYASDICKRDLRRIIK